MKWTCECGKYNSCSDCLYCRKCGVKRNEI